MIRANEAPKTKDSGIWYAHGYQVRYPDEWESDYQKGYANPEYWERISPNHWRLKAKAQCVGWRQGVAQGPDDLGMLCDRDCLGG